MYNQILVPTDGSGIDRVAESAIEIAAGTGATLYAVYVVDERVEGASNEDTQSVLEAEGERATGRIERLAADRDVDAETAIRYGVPHREILDYADELDADMIVMGTHGRTGLDRFLIGSVTDRVIRTGDVPVLAVNLVRQNATVTDAEQAVDVAREALSERGHEFDAVVEEPYRERETWIVRVETTDDAVFNVHINVDTGTARTARIE